MSAWRTRRCRRGKSRYCAGQSARKNRDDTRRDPPVADEYIERYLAEKQLDLTATTNPEAAYKNAELIIIAVPTDYDDKTNSFDTSVVDSVIEEIIDVNDSEVIVIKSTVPVGYTMSARQRYGCDRIIF